ncbi:MAG: peptide chain release factor N(5)-glutamine methyltransferase, partial [Acidimicrobiales bacterium]
HPGLAARVSFLRGDFYGALRRGMRGAVDLVVANPPYVAEREWAGLEPVVRDHDPYEALVAGPSGLEAIEAVVTGAPGVLRRPGALAVEIAPHQAEAAVRLAERAGLVDVAVRPDLAGRPRVLVASHL